MKIDGRRYELKHALLGASVVLGVLMAFAAFFSPSGAWPLAIGALGCLIIGNIDKFTEITASAKGVSILMKSTENKIDQLTRDVAKVSAQSSLLALQRGGRMGKLGDEEEANILQENIQMLKSTGFTEDEIGSIREPVWDRYVIFDYAGAILGGNTVPETEDQKVIEEWKTLRGRFDDPPTPKELEAFLQKTEALHGLRRELLDEYRFYLEHRRHKNAEVWGRREEVKRIPQ